MWIKPESVTNSKQINPLDVERKYKMFEHQMVKYMAMVVGGKVAILTMESDW